MKKTHITLAAGFVLASSASFGSVILNEFNAVRDSRWLDTDGAAASTDSDSYFGRIEGNGGRWFEALVVGNTSTPGETIDMRGWSFSWSDGDLGSGSFSLTNDSALSSIHRGTLITFLSEDSGGPSVGSNLLGIGTSTAAGGNLDQYDPANGSWWLNINIADTNLVTAGGTLLTGNADWQVTIEDSSENTVFGPVGEGVGTLSGVNSREVGKLEETYATIAGWQAVTPSSGYNDGKSSTFGGENSWSSGSNVQDFSPLQVVPEPSAFAALAGVMALGLVALRRRR